MRIQNKMKVAIKQKYKPLKDFSQGTLVILCDDPDGDFFIILISDAQSDDVDTFSGTVIYSSNDKCCSVGHHSTEWAKESFSSFEGHIDLDQ